MCKISENLPVITIGEGYWGNVMEWNNFAKRKVHGWRPRPPVIGQRVEAEMQSGRTAVFEIENVKTMLDPPDMYFATLKDIGYKDEI